MSTHIVIIVLTSVYPCKLGCFREFFWTTTLDSMHLLITTWISTYHHCTFYLRFLSSALFLYTLDYEIHAGFHPITVFRALFMSKHLNLPRLTTSDTDSMSKISVGSHVDFLSLSVKPHIHPIILSILSNLCVSSTFIAQVSLLSTIIL